MSGFGFGGFDLASGLGSFSDIGDKLQKLKEDVESTIDATLRPDHNPDEDEAGEETGKSLRLTAEIPKSDPVFVLVALAF